MNKFSGNKFLLYAISVLLFVLFQILNFEPKKNFILKIQANKDDISSIDDIRKIKLSSIKFIDTINFPSSKYLTHLKHGPIGFDKNYFLDFRGKFNTLEKGEYEIKITSDDGYKLFIDDKIISQHIKDRPANSFDEIEIELDQGFHDFFMTYFQGYGNAALEVMYRKKGDKNFRHLGKDSKLIKFSPFT